MTQTCSQKLIHIGCYILPKKGRRYLMLRQKDETQVAWYERQPDGSEVELELSATNPEEAFRLANKAFKEFSFRFINCGFRYTLPERDEHGINALFWQMVASQSSMNGVYFDDEVGHNCYVQAASDEAINLWHHLNGKL